MNGARRDERNVGDMVAGLFRSTDTRQKRARAMARVLKRLYPENRTALRYNTPWELLVAVQLSAQCTDKQVNEVTGRLFKKYRTLADYCGANADTFAQDIYPCGFYRNKTRNILAAARVVLEEFYGRVPKTMEPLLRIPGIGRKSANVIAANLYGLALGVAVDTHVRRFAIRFDLSVHTDPARIERDLMTLLPRGEWRGFNHRLVQYGREICPARHHECALHPLTRLYPKAAGVWPKAR